MALYQALYDGEEIIFNLADVKVIMERAKNFCYINLEKFERKVSFPLNRYEHIPAIEVY